MIELLLFLICAGCAAAGAVGAALVRNLFHAAMLLGLALVGVAGLYLFLEAHWLACVQVVVYVGGILVLVLFATLFSADVMGAVQRASWPLRLAGGVGAVLGLAVAARLIQVVLANARALDERRAATGVPNVIDGGAPASDSAAAGTSAIGDLLVSSWYVPFLATGFLLTVALVAAVATVQRFRRPTEAGRG